MIVKFTEQEEAFLEQQAKAAGITKEDVLHNLLQQTIEETLEETAWAEESYAKWVADGKKSRPWAELEKELNLENK